MSYVFFIPPSAAHDLAVYTGDDSNTLMAQCMLARGELGTLDTAFTIKAIPPFPEPTFRRVTNQPGQQAYLRLGRHYKGGK